VQAASRAYFSEDASDLGPNESALLAAAIINPRRLNPARPGTRLIRRQQLILRRMGAVSPPESAPESAPEAVPPLETEAQTVSRPHVSSAQLER